MEHAFRNTELTQEDTIRLRNAHIAVRKNNAVAAIAATTVGVLFGIAQLVAPDSMKQKLQRTFKDEAAAVTIGVVAAGVVLAKGKENRQKLKEIKEFQKNYIGVTVPYPCGEKEVAAALQEKAEKDAAFHIRMQIRDQNDKRKLASFAQKLGQPT